MEAQARPLGGPSDTGGDGPAGSRARLLAGLPVAERRLEAAGVSTSVLLGGAGPPLVLLHGPGESAISWMRVVPELARTHTVIAPDLPGHGASSVAVDVRLDRRRALAWLGELLDRVSPEPPAVVGHVLGGGLAARFAVDESERLRRLVLVDALGLAPFRPAPRFLVTMIGFLARPTEGSYNRFMRQCSYDLDGLRDEMGGLWKPFVDYNIALARAPAVKVARRLMREVGLPQIPAEDLARITVPTALIWGRHDRANRLRVAEAASARWGWPLHVIEDCADDPARDRPEAFLDALRAALEAEIDHRPGGHGHADGGGKGPSPA
jgi:pimeloyl-ACP methyl ester carboxylesterase